MRRRTVIAGLAALCLAPQRSSAQQSQGKIPRVGILTAADTERTRSLDAFRQGLRDLGYIEGRNIILEFRLAHGDYSLFPQLTAELVALPVDVVVSEGGVSLVAKASGPVPVVVPTIFDPVGQGVATSLSRPGGNVTGFTLMSAELDAKRLALLRSTFPQVTAVSALMDPANPMHKAMLEGIGRAAASMSLPDPRRVEAESVAALARSGRPSFRGPTRSLSSAAGCFGTTVRRSWRF